MKIVPFVCTFLLIHTKLFAAEDFYISNCPDFVIPTFNLGVECPVSIKFKTDFSKFSTGKLSCTYTFDETFIEKKYSTKCTSAGCHDGWCSVFFPEYNSIRYFCNLFVIFDDSTITCKLFGEK